ncbi:MAG: histidine ammonia-lyase [Candidatus Izemoplasmatales bacterium]|nr:histidine ammonia-lyase [Candidatus Izemoplasmatales bacterium]
MIVLDGRNLNIEKLVRISRGWEKVKVAPESLEQIQNARSRIEEIVEIGAPVYGINTGFGKLADTPIENGEVSQLQKNLLMSHACGVGNPYSEDIVRGMMALRINALIKGYSGIRMETIMKLMELLNKRVTPVVFEQGSLGASGDLAPLSHMSLPLIGLGEVYYKGKRMPAKEGLKRAGILPLDGLRAKEGLCLINGTQAMTSVGAHVLYDACNLHYQAIGAYAMTMEALRGIVDAFDERIHRLRGHKGQIAYAISASKMLENSQLVTRQNELRVQDAYSLRCAPQVGGAIADTIGFVRKVVETEMNAVTDNPLVFEDGSAISAGNFHGEPLAFAFDYLGIALSELANISERRIERMVNANLSNGLPPFLVAKPGLNSGFMIVQYSAASLVSENKVLSHPASVDSIPSSANQEDHVSMGSISARKAKTILENTRRVIAMEYFASAQAIDFRDARKMAPKTKPMYDVIRQSVPFIEKDDTMYVHIQRIENLLISGELSPKEVLK